MGDHIEKYITGGRAFNDAPDASAASPFERLSSVISRVRDLRKFSEVIADRMVGAREAEGVERTLRKPSRKDFWSRMVTPCLAIARPIGPPEWRVFPTTKWPTN